MLHFELAALVIVLGLLFMTNPNCLRWYPSAMRLILSVAAYEVYMRCVGVIYLVLGLVILFH
ncbi:MAG: hypothetical protein JO316_16715 [Abitibacteriaceae bacterium]|nr:hypothetical protein [Abditibacteriaceae bacterium]MBV9866997.1 hypothetical protein [Abditibacteriaceae bacterium]